MEQPMTINEHGFTDPYDAARARSFGSSLLNILLMAIRPQTLVLSVVPVMAGSYWAWATHATVSSAVVICAIVASAAIQIGTNLWNDVKDGMRGQDGTGRLGPPRMTALGLASPKTLRLWAYAAFGTAIACGLVLVAIGGWPIVVIGVVSIACGLAYSAGPRPISFSPHGELFVLVFFGIVAVAGTYYLHTGLVSASSIGLGAIVGLPAAAVLLVNNHRDRISDEKAGRRTLAIVVGRKGTHLLYGAMMVLSVVGAALFLQPHGWVGWLAMAVPMVVAVWFTLGFRKEPVSPRLNAYLGRTGSFQLLLAVSIAVAVGFPN
ncbi:1,4-dihydroxy-2-naphthoate octaprenyltransferase [Rhodobium orientis]|uniref:1,4-dihydroxy-2-naphthoate octaprenyltransferase n=2 Tax=Rhodobium orientis TaxID=34017 RepID=A0A327JNC3_9HYPH|nr:1,4-dihydroxy-2-naphthoate octaprenyltransferase [Rhodobium orientis]RAI27817.1 1,4-dihydroxy-2-naphthoate octaprenyltransferase [Rhodobium orientis]